MSTSLMSQTVASTDFFESIYAEAHGDPSRIPWADQRPHPALVTWLNAVAPSLVRSGSRVAVVGCGLGDDARELIRRGYDVTAFDCSETAIEWARNIDPQYASNFVVADLFELPTRWRHRYDLVVEINTLQSLATNVRSEAMKSIASLLSRHGCLLVICRGAMAPVPTESGPPWPIMERELLAMAHDAGLRASSPVTSFNDDENPAVLRMRALFHRA
jgi:SAM-dependent methyltransferase